MDLLHQGKTVHLRHHVVQQDQGKRLAGLLRLLQHRQRLFSAGDHGRFHAPTREHALQDAAVGGIVVDGQDRQSAQPHTFRGEPPLDRFAQPGFSPRFPDPVLLQDVFRMRVKRKVHPKTATVEVDGVFFQCESFLRGRWVRVFHDPFKLDDVLVFLGDQRVQRAFPQKVNAPQPAPERPVAAPPSFDYLSALRAEFDRRIVEQAKHLSLSEWRPSETLTLKPFLDLCVQMLGKDISVYEREELTRSFNGVGPFSEKTVRLALEHALKLRGRGLHVSVYSHYLKTFHLAAITAHQE